MRRNLRRDERGISAIEMAILLPLLILLVMAVIEFGLYFVKYQIATRAVATISDTIQKNPAGATHDLAAQGGLSFLDLTNAPNFICAKSYADNAMANAGLCNMGEWQTGTPAGVAAGAPYFVAVRASSPHMSITPFTALSNQFPPPIDAKAVVMVNQAQTAIHGSQLLTTGSQWVVPAGITQVKATIVGAGGGGIYGLEYGYFQYAGASGAVVVGHFAGLTPGQVINYSVGSGGTPQTRGGNTIFNGITAAGGPSYYQGVRAIAQTGQQAYIGTLRSALYFNGDAGEGGTGGDTPLGLGFGGSNHGHGGLNASGYGGGGGAGATTEGSGSNGAIILEW